MQKDQTSNFFLSFILFVIVLSATFIVFMTLKRNNPFYYKNELLTENTEQKEKEIEKEKISKNFSNKIITPLDSSKNSNQNEIKSTGEDPDYLKSLDLIKRGNIEDAKSILENILAKNPKDVKALNELGIIHSLDLKDPEKARYYFEESLKINPKNELASSELIGIYEQAAELDQGLAFFTRLYEEKKNPQLARNIGAILNAQDKVAEAIPYLEAAAESQNPETITELADAYSENSQSDLAVKSYQEALHLELENSENSSEDPQIKEQKISNAYTNLISELFIQDKMDEVKRVLSEYKTRVKDGSEAANILESLEEQTL